MESKVDSFKQREAAAESLFINQLEAAVADRFRRIRILGSWACALIGLAPEEEGRFQDLLYRLALESRDDRVVIDRVYEDIRAAGVPVSFSSIIQVLDTAVDGKPSRL